MALASKLKKAERMGITFAEGHEPTETELDDLIDQKQAAIDQEKAEAKIKAAAEKKAVEAAQKSKVILKDVDGDDVDQADYFWPRLEDEKIVITNLDGSKTEKVFKATDQTAPFYFNKACGMPVDREDLIDVFVQFFPRRKGFLFYKDRVKESYLIIVPLKYAKTIGSHNESRPGDFQRHALSFVHEGSVNLDSLRLKLEKVLKHNSISTEVIDR